MPSATSSLRGQAGRDGWRRFNHPPPLPAAAALSFGKGLYRNSNLTPRITRPPTSSQEHKITRAAGRVHALVMAQRDLAAARACHPHHQGRCGKIAAPTLQR